MAGGVGLNGQIVSNRECCSKVGLLLADLPAHDQLLQHGCRWWLEELCGDLPAGNFGNKTMLADDLALAVDAQAGGAVGDQRRCERDKGRCFDRADAMFLVAINNLLLEAWLARMMDQITGRRAIRQRAPDLGGCRFDLIQRQAGCSKGGQDALLAKGSDQGG